MGKKLQEICQEDYSNYLKNIDLKLAEFQGKITTIEAYYLENHLNSFVVVERLVQGIKQIKSSLFNLQTEFQGNVNLSFESLQKKTENILNGFSLRIENQLEKSGIDAFEENSSESYDAELEDGFQARLASSLPEASAAESYVYYLQ